MFFVLLGVVGYVLNLVPFLVVGGLGITVFLCLLGSKLLLGDGQHMFLSEVKSYECGFEYGVGGSGFSLQFYIVGLSFLLFDLEICLFTPLVGSLWLGGFSLKIGLGFLLLILFLLVYEYFTGALNW
uniref:NADH-ubiquinone oxidoreductase chain 3 n=1 Tax=Botrylloides giganteus TaxID=2034436 RepID=A0A024GX52_9ASCI|nr:NADH dehydrogenase subunit 3 [Botrylloides giganteus]CCO25727.1 NADH dehydrogenase subunit 3 [Botrylloides giganteus]CDM98955.1 NADH dehydrogenase subunit 3 [Botrylloides giganteus]